MAMMLNGSPSPSADSKDPLVLGARTLPFFQPVKVPGEGDGKDGFINDGKDDFINGGKDDFIIGGKDKNKV
ncbi:hypothetical protein HaLaN_20944, partial [Haematococcus lacustris]